MKKTDPVLPTCSSQLRVRACVFAIGILGSVSTMRKIVLHDLNSGCRVRIKKRKKSGGEQT